jgi:cytochrome c oxidase subunit 2
MSWGLPAGASTFASDIDTLYYAILVITGIIFVAVEIVLVYFLVKYRGREGRRAEYITGSTRAEVIWTAIPAIIVVGLAFASKAVWDDVKDRGSVPADALHMQVAAKQFEWNVTYPGMDRELDTDDDFTVRNQLHLPVDQPVVVHLTAEDVIHSFFIPEFRVKQDATPGLVVPVWFEATETGEYELACAELCGLGHYRMRGSVTVHTAEDFERWMQAETGGTQTATSAAGN